MRAELLSAHRNVEDQLRELDRVESRLEFQSDLASVLAQVAEIASNRAALMAQRTFLDRVIAKEGESDRVNAEIAARRHEEEKRDRVDAEAAAKKRRSEDKPREVMREVVGGLPRIGPTGLRR